MEPVRGTWTDERLDYLNGRMDNGFNRVDEDLRALRVETRTELGSLRSEIGTESRSLRNEIGALRSEMNSRFDAMQRTMIQFGGGMIVALLGLIVTVALQH
jgi:hypothetical protein